MKIGMVLDKQFPPDIRVENEALSLIEGGHEVYLLNLSHNSALPISEVFKGISITRIIKPKKWIQRGRGLINTIFDYYSYYWSRQIILFSKKNVIQALHIHDLYLLKSAYIANRKLNLPIIADLHENYVEGLKHYSFARRFPGNILISIKRWTRKEIEWCKQATNVITVIEEAVDRYSKLGIERDKIFVVANYVNSDRFLDTPDDLSILERLKNNFIITYIGFFDRHRGLESIMKALPALVKQIPNIKLVLVGDGPNRESLAGLARNLSVFDHVLFEGFQQPARLPSYIKASSICLIPHLKSVHTDNTIPHKLFHYMLLGKPIVATDCNPLKRIINDTNCGLIYESGDSDQFFNPIYKLYQNKDQMQKMGNAGRIAVEKKYNWTNSAKTLLDLYKKLK